MLSLNKKRLVKRFLDWKISLMLNWGSVLLKQLYNLDLKFKESWPKNGRTIKTSFFRDGYQKSFRYINPIQESINTLVY